MQMVKGWKFYCVCTYVCVLFVCVRCVHMHMCVYVCVLSMYVRVSLCVYVSVCVYMVKYLELLY